MKYLSIYQANRIDFDFYGWTRKLQDNQIGMLLAFLIISGVTVQGILFKIKDNFDEFKDYPHIEITAKYIGSIMDYITIDTFNNNPAKLNEILALMNYYRSYHIFNRELEFNDDIDNIELSDEDEFSQFLILRSSISEFWNVDANFIETFKSYVYSWACRSEKLIRLKYQKNDAN